MTNQESYSFEILLAFLDEFHSNNPKEQYTILEFLSMAVEAASIFSDIGWNCFSCGENAFDIGEDYYVHDHLWRAYGVEGILCIGCLEFRMGRKLTPEDFYESHTPSPEEAEVIRSWRARMDYTPSERLLDRCGGDYVGRDGYVKIASSGEV